LRAWGRKDKDNHPTTIHSEAEWQQQCRGNDQVGSLERLRVFFLLAQLLDDDLHLLPLLL
jgi:hypothetical protein